MSNKRYAVILLRFGFLASIVLTIFWGVWHLSGHQVPNYTSLKVTDNILWTFPVSRWWDILFAFLIVNVYAWILRIYYRIGLKFTQKEDINFGFVASIVASIVAGIGVSLGVGLGVSFIAGLVVLINMLFLSNFGKPVYNWFIAKKIS